MLSFYMEKAKQESQNCPDLTEGIFWSGCLQEEQCCYSKTSAAEQMDLSNCNSSSTVSAQSGDTVVKMQMLPESLAVVCYHQCNRVKVAQYLRYFL